MTHMVATVNGNGPYLPVIVFGDRRHVVGDRPFGDLQEAMARAISVMEDIRDTMRAPGFDEILARLP
jgi:hypothetical protein